MIVGTPRPAVQADRRARRSLGPGFRCLVVTQALVAVGHAAIVVALADSFFFSVSPEAARGDILRYLLLTMTPFALVSPFLGPAIDRARAGHRRMAAISAAGRGALCVAMAWHLEALLLFPEAFAVLVLAKSHTVAKSALVPHTVDHDALVTANARLSLTTVAASAFGAALAVAGAGLAGDGWVLRGAAVVFAAGAVSARRLPSATPAAGAGARAVHCAGAELRRQRHLMAMLRGAVGFFGFFAAFALRRSDAAASWFAVVAAATTAGTLAGNGLASRLRQVSREVLVAPLALALVVATSALAAATGARAALVVVAAVLGLAGSSTKLCVDAIVQRGASGSGGVAFARMESVLQLSFVTGALLAVAVPLGVRAGLAALTAAGLVVLLVHRPTRPTA